MNLDTTHVAATDPKSGQIDMRGSDQGAALKFNLTNSQEMKMGVIASEAGDEGDIDTFRHQPIKNIES